METVEHIDGYPIIRILGEGGMGVVYEALDPTLGDKRVALKTIKMTGSEEDEVWLERFKGEAQMAGHLKHRHIITIYGVNLEHEPPYMVMELLEGGTLFDHLQKTGPLPWQDAMTLLLPMLYALAYAHDVGVIHRDIKPENMMFDLQRVSPGVQDKVLKLTDFGLARDLRSDRFTVDGTILGTLAYMSPEQANGEVVDGKTDLFAMGLILFETITGFNPQDKGGFLETLDAVRSDVTLDLSALEKRVPPNVMELVKRATNKDRYKRHATADEMLEEWQQCLQDVPTPPPSGPPPNEPPVDEAEADGDGHQTPIIILADGVTLPPDGEEILRLLFPDMETVLVEEEFGDGFTARVYLVLRHDKQGKDLPRVVVKIAHKRSIAKEYRAYKNCIENKPFSAIAAPIISEPASPEGRNQAGLCYKPAGHDVFKIRTLKEHFEQASVDELLTLLKQLTEVLKGIPDIEPKQKGFSIWNSYEHVLPVNLHVKPSHVPKDKLITPIKPYNKPDPLPKQEDFVKLIEFVVTKVNDVEQEVTLNFPIRRTSNNHPPLSFSVRLIEVKNIESFEVGQVAPPIEGVVVATRKDLLEQRVQHILDEDQLKAKTLKIEPHDEVKNPILTVLAELLPKYQQVKFGCIHGDLHLNNIIFVVGQDIIQLIDFADARCDHILHDFFRLETSIMTWLLPDVLTRLECNKAETIYEFYKQLDWAMRFPDRKDLPTPADERIAKLFWVIVEIRRAASQYGFFVHINDWQEYYQGLAIYLTGSLRFGEMSEDARRVAFWAAATACQFYKELPQVEEDTIEVEEEDDDDDDDEVDDDGGKDEEIDDVVEKDTIEVGEDVDDKDKDAEDVVNKKKKISRRRVAIASLAIFVVVGILAWFLWPEPPVPPISLTTTITTTDETVLQSTPLITLTVKGEEPRSPDQPSPSKATFILPGEWISRTAVLTVEVPTYELYTNTLVLQQPTEEITVVLKSSPVITGMVEITESDKLTYTFYIDEQEVTVDDYKNCVDAGGACTTVADPGGTGSFPVVNVTWQQASTYCESLGKTLPTEAEWTYAISNNIAQFNELSDVVEIDEWTATKVLSDTSAIVMSHNGDRSRRELKDINEKVGFRCAYRE